MDQTPGMVERFMKADCRAFDWTDLRNNSTNALLTVCRDLQIPLSTAPLKRDLMASIASHFHSNSGFPPSTSFPCCAHYNATKITHQPTIAAKFPARPQITPSNVAPPGSVISFFGHPVPAGISPFMQSLESRNGGPPHELQAPAPIPIYERKKTRLDAVTWEKPRERRPRNPQKSDTPPQKGEPIDIGNGFRIEVGQITPSTFGPPFDSAKPGQRLPRPASQEPVVIVCCPRQNAADARRPEISIHAPPGPVVQKPSKSDAHRLKIERPASRVSRSTSPEDGPPPQRDLSDVAPQQLTIVIPKPSIHKPPDLPPPEPDPPPPASEPIIQPPPPSPQPVSPSQLPAVPQESTDPPPASSDPSSPAPDVDLPEQNVEQPPDPEPEEPHVPGVAVDDAVRPSASEEEEDLPAGREWRTVVRGWEAMVGPLNSAGTWLALPSVLGPSQALEAVRKWVGAQCGPLPTSKERRVRERRQRELVGLIFVLLHVVLLVVFFIVNGFGMTIPSRI